MSSEYGYLFVHAFHSSTNTSWTSTNLHAILFFTAPRYHISSHAKVGSVGVVAIASALEQNVSLDRLDLSYCEIDDKGIHKLSISLRSNTTLRFLNIEGNYISSSGMHSLLKCVYDTTSLRSLWENSNHFIRAFYGQRPIYSPRWVNGSSLGVVIEWKILLLADNTHSLAPSFSSSHSIIIWHSFPETPANRLLVRQLEQVLATCNRRHAEPSWSSSASAVSNNNTSHKSQLLRRSASCKILRHCTMNDSMHNWECVESIEVEALAPHAFSWLANHGTVGLMCSVIREMPWLVARTVDNTTNSR